MAANKPVLKTRAKIIWRKATSLLYHIRQVAARVAKLVLVGASGTPFWEKGES